MAVVYATGTPLDGLDPVDLAQRLSEVVASALPRLEALSAAAAREPLAPGKWSTKQVIGHLVDSAVNNLQRMVRLESSEESQIASLGYEQEGWVHAQHYNEKSWVEILALWHILNEHIAWTMRHVSRHHLERLCVFPESQMTFGFLLEDYIAHLDFHLKALHQTLDS